MIIGLFQNKLKITNMKNFKFIVRRRCIRGFKNNLSAIMKVILTGNIFNENYIKIFEEKFKENFDYKYALSCGSGRQALNTILLGLNLTKGDEVILPAYTLSSLFEIVEDLGLVAVPADISLDSYNIDVSKIKVSARSKCLIVNHMFGQCCNMEEVNQFAKQHKLYVIEDCAHAHGSKIDNEYIGKNSDAAFYSFDSVKPISTIFGGMIVTNNSALYKQILHIQESFQSPSKIILSLKFFQKFLEYIVLTTPLFYMFLPVLYFNNVSKIFNKTYIYISKKKKLNIKMSNLQAFIGIRELNFYKERNSIRRKNSMIMRSHLKNLTFQEETTNESSEYFLIAKSSMDLRKLQKKLLLSGIDIHIREELANVCGNTNNHNAQAIFDSVFQIPNDEELSRKDITKIINVLNEIP